MEIVIYIPYQEDCEQLNNPVFQYLRFSQKDALYGEKSGKEHIYGPLSPMYHIYKSTKERYIGFFMPDRYMAFSEDTLEEDNNRDVMYEFLDDIQDEISRYEDGLILSHIAGCSVVLTHPIQVKSVYETYCSSPYKNKEHLDLLISLIQTYTPQFTDSMDVYLKGDQFYPHLFLMERSCFMEYMEWLFSILSEVEKRICVSSYGRDMVPVCWYLAEIMLGVYFTHKQGHVPTSLSQRYYIQNINIQEELKPAFDKHNVPVVLTTSNSYALYAGVVLQSILETISASVCYDIIILHTNLTNDMQQLFYRMAAPYANVSIRFFNVYKHIRKFIFKATHPFVSHATSESYYRILCQSIFRKYDKILWLDCDVIVKKDLYDLYQTELEDHLLAAAIDPGWYVLYNRKPNDEFQHYVDKSLHLIPPIQYFQQGVLLINIKGFKQTVDQDELIRMACNSEYIFYDQDIFNIVCQNKVAFLDMRWNVLADVSGERVNAIQSLAPTDISEQYMQARSDPYIIHYAGGYKPWENPLIDYAYEFWKIARNTELYEILIKNMINKETNKTLVQSKLIAKHVADVAVKKHITKTH